MNVTIAAAFLTPTEISLAPNFGEGISSRLGETGRLADLLFSNEIVVFKFFFPDLITHGIMVDMPPKWVSTQKIHERRCRTICRHIEPYKNLWEYAKNGQKSLSVKKFKAEKIKSMA